MRQLREFVLPYIAIRNRGRGYAVSIVKAGMDAIGRPAGSVRPPLTDLLPLERTELKTLIDAQRARPKLVHKTA
jgi:5-dehydro-4-deoxyglucarate dehydratase